MKFQSFNISEDLLKGIQDMGFEEASPIQIESILPLLGGRDVIGQAQTGTGKTAAFGIPLLEKTRENEGLQGLVLCPTRELCIQVSEEIARLGKYKKGIRILPVYGGSSIERQIRSIKKGVEIVVGTPGRLMDLMRKKILKFDGLKIVVLDEADEMFDMGFRDDMKFILEATNDNRQTCFFSATMGQEIQDFSKIYQKNPAIIKIKHKEVTVEKIDQYFLEMKQSMKTEVLSRLIDIYDPKLSIVFCNTKRKVDDLVVDLTARGYSVDGLHGDLKQNQRDNVMSRFRKGQIEILVATDVAARGIDVENIDIVFNYDLPQLDEYYVHRIGRTARAGKKGMSFSFIAGRDIQRLKDIKKYTKAQIDYMEVPTLSQMDRTFENNLVEKIGRDLDKGLDLAKEKVIIERLLSNGYESVEIASLLLKIVTKKAERQGHQRLDQIDYNRREKRDKKEKDRGRSKRKDKYNKDIKMARVFINKGKRDGLNAINILDAFKKETNIPKNAIGQIRIKNNFTFVDLEEGYTKKAIAGLDGKNIYNVTVKVEKSN